MEPNTAALNATSDPTALDAFLFDQLRAVLSRPDLLLTGEQTVAAFEPVPDDELLDAELSTSSPGGPADKLPPRPSTAD